ncbi:hypothetical protein N5C16_19145 [Stenotrophomonas sp. GD03908]|uniref:Transmembrane protein n=1 Tax=Stenotrophomonas maltophilia TaxID=40324 RepID=A0AAJ2WJ65_STEMA|nr:MULTISPECIES: hypothetical protein [Stenotrophomonas]MBH1483288.1 hypothetical protein [Stenotrophomonas maltophilia]MDH0981393.1 hypothetical protein [Stenotrophomonas sp. GD03908]MDQ7295030.1 hypothetical protein [Stenotrophomonas sp. Sm0041]MDZ5764356.1 hypothetical protein [Stenotrophomonas maltophilia]
MVTLYLWVRTLLPLLAFVIAWMLLSRLIKARVARLPRVPLNLPEHSSSPRRKDRRIYARKLRRKPSLRTATRPATAPRSWNLAAVFVSLCALVAAVLVMPDGARFQVMVESITGYPATIAEVHVPAARQTLVLQAWQPTLVQLSQPVTMRYPIGRTGGEHDAHATLPVQVRHQGDRLQVATAVPVDGDVMRAELTRLAGLPTEAITVRQSEISPWREPGWKPLAER